MRGSLSTQPQVVSSQSQPPNPTSSQSLLVRREHNDVSYPAPIFHLRYLPVRACSGRAGGRHLRIAFHISNPSAVTILSIAMPRDPLMSIKSPGFK